MVNKNSKRQFLKVSSGLALFAKFASIGFLVPTIVQASTWKKTWFSTVSLSDTLKVMGVNDFTESERVIISAPDTAENGAYVGVSVETDIETAEMVAILVEKNPNMLAGYFEFSSKVSPNISTKIKMAESSNIITVVKTSNNDYFMAKKSVNVTLGGCGS